jgi:hypothetical protein
MAEGEGPVLAGACTVNVPSIALMRNVETVSALDSLWQPLFNYVIN